MAIELINTGTSANAGNGDSIRSAFSKVNLNFEELQTSVQSIQDAIDSGEIGGGSTGTFIDFTTEPGYPLNDTGELTFFEISDQSSVNPMLFRRGRGTLANISSVVAGDELGELQFQGIIYGEPITGAGISVVVEEEPLGSVPCRIDFLVSDNTVDGYGARASLSSTGTFKVDKLSSRDSNTLTLEQTLTFPDNTEQSTAWTGEYTPGTPSDWNGTAPTTIAEAIDRLAALVKILNSGTGA